MQMYSLVTSLPAENPCLREEKSNVKMLPVGCCILQGAAQRGASLGEEEERADCLCSLPWSDSSRTGSVLRLSCRSGISWMYFLLQAEGCWLRAPQSQAQFLEGKEKSAFRWFWHGQSSSREDNKAGSLPVSCQVIPFSKSSPDKTHHPGCSW